MAKIYLLIGHSLSFYWLHHLIGANRGLLARYGIALVPFDRSFNDFLPLNDLFWLAPADGNYSPELLERIVCARNSLEQGRNILVLGGASDLKLQEQFFAFLARNFPGADVVPIIVIGKPTILLETLALATNCILSRRMYEEWQRELANLPYLVLSARQKYGDANTHVIPDLNDRLDKKSIENLCTEIFSVLGIDDRPDLESLLPFYGFTNTATAKRLIEAMQVHYNDWPRLDYQAYMSALQKLDAVWEPEPVCPLTLRQDFLARSKAIEKKLAIILGIASQSLDAPDWYGSLPGLDESRPLDPDRLDSFATSLPPASRQVLLQRFANDRSLLTQDQKDLAMALAKAESTDFSHLGEIHDQPVLTVLTMTRDHEKYIGQCIEGVLAQKTNFAVRHLVLDHYSIDGTPQIIISYASRYPSIRPILLHNYYEYNNNVSELFSRCHSEYVALCDGDDYFTDPLKLQKQFDFLQSHPDSALCFHPVRVVFEGGENEDFVFPPENAMPCGMREEYDLSDLIRCNFIQTNSVVYRWRFRAGLPGWFRHDLCPGDWYWHLLHAENGRIGFLQEPMAVYRRHKKAAFANSFIDNRAHRCANGLKELETLQVINEHFGNRYFLCLAKLSADIFFDFLKDTIENNDSSLLKRAGELFPAFGKYFLDNVNLSPNAMPCNNIGKGIHAGQQ